MNNGSYVPFGEYSTDRPSGLVTDFVTLTPWFTTSGGSWEAACEYLRLVRTWSTLGSVVTSKSTRSCIWLPALWLSEYMYNILSTPLICCSIGVATDCSSVTASAPGYRAVSRISEIGRKLGGGLRVSQVGEDLVDARVGGDVEIDPQLHLAAGALVERVHVQHLVDAAHLLLDRRGHRLLERHGIGARIPRGQQNLRDRAEAGRRPASISGW